MFINRFRDIFIVVFLLVVYCSFFISKDNGVFYKTLEGTIYDIEKPDEKFTSANTREDFIFTDKKFPTLNVYSELSLPDTFIARRVQSKTTADYIVVSDKLLERKYVFKPLVASKKEIKKKKTEKKQKPAPKKKTVKPKRKTKYKKPSAVLNYHTLQNIVSKSEKTYFYADLIVRKTNVQLKLISFTPFKDKGILKVSLENNSKQYFFVATVNITNNKDKIPSDFFGAQFIAPSNSQVLFILMRDITIKKGLVLNVIESGGQERWLKIKFSLP